MRIGIFDLGSFFWTLAGTREKEQSPTGLALDVAQYMRNRAEQLDTELVLFGADGPSAERSSSWRRSVDPNYKGDRKPKDEAHRAELAALIDALTAAGFPVISSEFADDEDLWFEADDVCASAAAKVVADKHIALVVSNDWDLAQLLALPHLGPNLPDVNNGVLRVYTTRGEERTAKDVLTEFGVGPEKLGWLKALAGDSDGYKPFPGAEKGKQGIGTKTAAAILTAFGTAQAAMSAALGNLDSAFIDKGIRKGVPELLRAGGQTALSRGQACAMLRFDVEIPDDLEIGEWDEVLTALGGRKLSQKAAEARLARGEKMCAEDLALLGMTEEDVRKLRERTNEESAPEAAGPRRGRRRLTTSVLPAEGEPHDPEDHGGTPHDDGPAEEEPDATTPEDDMRAKAHAQLTQASAGIAAMGEQAKGAAESIPEVLGAIEQAQEPVDDLPEIPPLEAAPPADDRRRSSASEEAAPKVDESFEMLFTDAEFGALASLYVLWRSGAMPIPEGFGEIETLADEIADGPWRRHPRGLIVGKLSGEAVAGLTILTMIIREVLVSGDYAYLADAVIKEIGRGVPASFAGDLARWFRPVLTCRSPLKL